jgi:hypothetical protein
MVTLINVVFVFLLATVIPKSGDVPTVGVVLLGIGLQKKKLKLLSHSNKLLYNFGVMHDFFNYSAMSI